MNNSNNARAAHAFACPPRTNFGTNALCSFTNLLWDRLFTESSGTQLSGNGVWPFATVNDKHFGEIKVCHFSDIYDPHADEFQNLMVSLSLRPLSIAVKLS